MAVYTINITMSAGLATNLYNAMVAAYTTLASSPYNYKSIDPNAPNPATPAPPYPAAVSKLVIYASTTTLPVPTSLATALASGGTLTVGTTYYYVVTALNSSGETTQSTQISAIPTTGNQTINVSWGAVTGATSYKVYRSTVSGTFTTPALAGNPATNSFSDTGVALTAGAPPATNTATQPAINLVGPQGPTTPTLTTIASTMMLGWSNKNTTDLRTIWLTGTGTAGITYEII